VYNVDDLDVLNISFVIMHFSGSSDVDYQERRLYNHITMPDLLSVLIHSFLTLSGNCSRQVRTLWS